MQHLNINPEKRIETGPLKIGDDWPGTFIRGDNAFMFMDALRRIREHGLNPKSHDSIILLATLDGMIDLLDECIQKSKD